MESHIFRFWGFQRGEIYSPLWSQATKPSGTVLNSFSWPARARAGIARENLLEVTVIVAFEKNFGALSARCFKSRQDIKDRRCIVA